MQELSIPPGLGRAATKTAMKAVTKRASLENIVKMSERVGFQVVSLEVDTKLGIRVREFTMTHDETL